MVQLQAGWEERVSKSRGIPYYFNSATGESRWDPPINSVDQHSHDNANHVHAYHLLVKHAQSRRPSSWRSSHITCSPEEALQQLQQYEEQIRSAINEGQDGLTVFRELASKVSDCSSAKQGGDLGEFGRGQMQKAFEEATWSLAPGQMSGPVSTDSGWHLIYRIS